MTDAPELDSDNERCMMIRSRGDFGALGVRVSSDSLRFSDKSTEAESSRLR